MNYYDKKHLSVIVLYESLREINFYIHHLSWEISNLPRAMDITNENCFICNWNFIYTTGLLLNNYRRNRKYLFACLCVIIEIYLVRSCDMYKFLGVINGLEFVNIF